MASFVRHCALLALALGALSSPVANELASTEDHVVTSEHLVARAEIRSTDDPRNPSPDHLGKRATCKDNLGRCFNPTGSKPTDIASRAAATAFCSSFLSIPVVTSTIGTTTPVTSVTVTATVIAGTATETSVIVSNIEATETTTTLVTALARRAVTSVAPPNCAAGSYSPVQLSSACACVSVAPLTTYVTATAPVETSTAVNTKSETTTTVTVTTSVVTIGTTTVVATETATGPSSPPATLCSDAATPYVVGGKKYTKHCDRYYYDGEHELARTTDITKYSDCIKFCADTPGCVYAYWVSPNSQYSDKLFCYAFSTFEPANLRDAPGTDGISLDV